MLSVQEACLEQDMRGLAPSDSVQLLPRDLDAATQTAFAHGGTLTHFSPNRIDVLFGAPEVMDLKASLQAPCAARWRFSGSWGCSAGSVQTRT